jgi:hypothetical protein
MTCVFKSLRFRNSGSEVDVTQNNWLTLRSPQGQNTGNWRRVRWRRDKCREMAVSFKHR